MSTFADAPELTTTTQQATTTTTTTTGSLRGSTPEAVATAATNGSSSGSSELAEDGYPKDMEIPIRYVKGMEGDVVEARRRWIATLKVRKEPAAPCTALVRQNNNLEVYKRFSQVHTAVRPAISSAGRLRPFAGPGETARRVVGREARLLFA